MDDIDPVLPPEVSGKAAKGAKWCPVCQRSCSYRVSVFSVGGFWDIDSLVATLKGWGVLIWLSISFQVMILGALSHQQQQQQREQHGRKQQGEGEKEGVVVAKQTPLVGPHVISQGWA